MFLSQLSKEFTNYFNWWHFLHLNLLGATNTLHLRLLGSPTIIPSSQLKTAMTWYYYKRDWIFISSFLFSNDNVIESNFPCRTMANKKVFSNIRKYLTWNFTLNQACPAVYFWNALVQFKYFGSYFWLILIIQFIHIIDLIKIF